MRAYKCRTDKGIEELTEEELYGTAERMVWALLRKHYKGYYSHHEDMAQEILLALHNSMPRYDPDKGLIYSYILTIARRKAISYIKKLATRAKHETEITDEMAENLQAPQEVTPQAELLAWIAKLRSICTPQEKELIDLVLDGVNPNSPKVYGVMHIKIGQLKSIWQSIVNKAKKQGRPEEYT